jgi:hypothetical protein
MIPVITGLNLILVFAIYYFYNNKGCHMSANLTNQRLQTVLLLAGHDLGPKGVDGWKGDKTEAAIEEYGRKNGIDGGRSAIERAILDKLKDRNFIQSSLDELRENPQTRSNTAAIQVLLAAAGHNDLQMRNGIGWGHGIMHGRMNKFTEEALRNTEDGKPNAIALAASSNLALPRQSIEVALGNSFTSAAEGTSTAGVGSPQPASRVAAVTLAPVQ